MTAKGGDGREDRPGAEEPVDPEWPRRNVLGAGLTSALGDCTYETGQVLLPGFMTSIGASPAILGLIEGVADGILSLTRLAAGHVGNRWGHRKRLVLVGYALTPLGQALIALATVWPVVLLGRTVGWLGKGLRGPLRDAILAASVEPSSRGSAFGFHRSMDTVGAVAGPALGIVLLEWARGWFPAGSTGPFRVALWLTLVPGLLSVAAFAWLVRDPETGRAKALPFWKSLRGLPSEFRRYLAAVAVFGLGDFSHVMLVLAATTALTPEWGLLRAAQIAAGLYILRNLFQVAAAWPAGALADRLGPLKVLRAGYGMGAATAGLLAGCKATGSGSLIWLGTVFAIAGVYMAVQESLEPVATCALVDEDQRPLALGSLGAVNGLVKLLSSTLVGWVWAVASPAAALLMAALLMLAGAMLVPRGLRTG